MCARKMCWQNCKDCTLWSQNRGLIHRVHTEWRLPISGVHPIMMERSALAGEGWGCTPAHLSAYYHDVQSCSVLYTPAEMANTLPLFHLYPLCTRWTDQKKCTKSFIECTLLCLAFLVTVTLNLCLQELTRFYLQLKEDPHGPNVALFVGNLPSNLSHKQYETILLDYLDGTISPRML